MSKQINAGLGILAFVVLLGASFFAYNVLSENTDMPENIAEETNLQRASDFTMEDAAGNEVRLSDFIGQPVMLNFWATWCPACVRETPYFQNLYQEASNEVQILKVNLLGSRGETHNRVEEFMNAGGYTFPLFFDAAGEGARAYNITAIPITFFITAEGYIAATVQGSVNEDTLMRGVEKIHY